MVKESIFQKGLKECFLGIRMSIERKIIGSCFNCYHESGTIINQFSLVRREPVLIYRCDRCGKEYGIGTIGSMMRGLRKGEENEKEIKHNSKKQKV